MHSLEEVKKMNSGEFVKFVRVSGEYRFCDLYSNHSSLVKDGEKALSAGMISLRKGAFKFEDTYSMTLEIGVDKHDVDRLELLLGREFDD